VPHQIRRERRTARRVNAQNDRFDRTVVCGIINGFDDRIRADHFAAERDFLRFQKAGCRDKCDRADRAVSRRDRRRVADAKLSFQNKKRVKRNQRSDHETENERVKNLNAERTVRELLAAFETDRKEQIKRNEFDAALGNFKIAFKKRRKNAENKKQQGRIRQIRY